MKQILILLIILISGVTSLKSQQVSDKQWTLLHERTADWCPFCGTWGWDLKTKLMDKFVNETVIFMAVHHSGGLNNPTATAFSNNFVGSGQPIFYADGADLNANSGNMNNVLSDAEAVVGFNSTVPAFAGIGIDASFSLTTKTLTVNSKVEFLNDVENGDYYLGLYLVEDVINKQVSRTNSELHKNVLRTSLLEGAFGKSLVKGAVSKGKTFVESFSIPNMNADRTKIKIVGVIWNKVNNKYLFFNGNIANVAIPASIESFESDTKMSVYQSESGNLILDVDIVNEIDNAIFQVADVTGKVLVSQIVTNLHSGKQKINMEGSFAPGVHIVSLKDGSRIISKKLVIQ